jgi:hypothetical protein
MNNSLRRDIHAAFEVIESPLGGMPERVVQTVLAERNGRLRKERMTYRLRISFALVAAVLLVALGVATVMTWNGLHKNSNISPAGVGLTQVQQLEARPLNLPTVASASQCPESPHDTSPNPPGYQYGTGPVYADGGPETGTSWGHYWDVIYYAAPNLNGPILVRGLDLMSHDRHVVFVGAHAAGPVIGTDTAANTGNQHTELVLDASHPQYRSSSTHYGYWQIRQGMSNGWVGCVGFQIDGSNFTETITTFAAP